MSLEEVIKAGSNRPAGFLFPDENESDFLKIGNMADFTVFTLEASDEDVQDSQGVSLKLKKIIRPKLAVQGIHHEKGFGNMLQKIEESKKRIGSYVAEAPEKAEVRHAKQSERSSPRARTCGKEFGISSWDCVRISSWGADGRTVSGKGTRSLP